MFINWKGSSHWVLKIFLRALYFFKTKISSIISWRNVFGGFPLTTLIVIGNWMSFPLKSLQKHLLVLITQVFVWYLGKMRVFPHFSLSSSGICRLRRALPAIFDGINDSPAWNAKVLGRFPGKICLPMACRTRCA